MTTIATINSETNNIATQSIQSVINSSSSSVDPSTMTVTIDTGEIQPDVTSWDEVRWTTEASSGYVRKFNSICYGNDKFVAVGNGVIMYSLTGTSNWTQVSGIPTDKTFTGVCYGDGKFVATVTSSNTIYYSTTGTSNWTPVTVPNSRQWRDVCYADGKFVAVSYYGTTGFIMYSTDALTWTDAVTLQRGSYTSVAFGDGKFVAVSPAGYIVYSTPSSLNTWTDVPVTDMKSYSVCYGNGKFVAAQSNKAYIMYSEDGMAWTSVPVTQRDWTDVCFGNGMFVATARSTNIIMYSTDAINWTEVELQNTRYYNSICYGNGRFVIVNDGNEYVTDDQYVAYCASGSTKTLTLPAAVQFLFDRISTLSA